MSKHSKLTVGVALAILTLGSAVSARADESQAQGEHERELNQSTAHLEEHEALPSPPKVKASVSTTYFNMDGWEPANNNLYSFGSYTVLTEDVKLQYTVAPGWTAMLLAEYATDSVVVNIGSKSLPFKTSGIGDTLLEVIHPVLAKGAFSVTADAGFSLPTGSIDEENPYAPMHDAYFIQLGSGTFDGVAGLTSLYKGPFFNAGNRLFTEVRTGNNANGYHLGNLYKADAWLDFPLKYGFTPRIVGSYKLKRPITGWDYTLPRQPLTEYYYHNQVNWMTTAALRYDHPLWNRTSITAEADVPFYQGMSNVDNVSVKIHYYGMVSLNGQF